MWSQFLILKMKWSKCLIPNHDNKSTTLDIFSISIYNLVILKIQWTRNDMNVNCIACCAHQTKGFSSYVDHTSNHQNNSNSLIKFQEITSLANTTCPKKRSSSLTITSNWWNHIIKGPWLLSHNIVFQGCPCLNLNHVILKNDFHNTFTYYGRSKQKIIKC